MPQQELLRKQTLEKEVMRFNFEKHSQKEM